MIADRYLIYVCPDPLCERWNIEPGRCDDHHSHELGDYPDLMELVVLPAPSVRLAYMVKHGMVRR